MLAHVAIGAANNALMPCTDKKRASQPFAQADDIIGRKSQALIK
jgi:hypothetical protein